MRKVAMLAVVIGIAFVAIPVHAAPPTVEKPEETSSSFPNDDCGFLLLFEFEGKSGEIIFEPRGHRVEQRENTFDPGTKVTVTNPSTGESITLNAAGPMTRTLTPNDDGGFTGTAEARGNWIHIHETEGEILWTNGYFIQTAQLDAGFNLISFEEDLSKARVTDLCDVLS
jgi:hypothetical protein